MRTESVYKDQVSLLAQQSNASHVSGLKRNSELNEKINNFHVTKGLPPDIVHDLLEGIVPFEIALCLNKFIEKDYVSLDVTNCIIETFKYRGKDSVNRPQKIPNSFAVKQTIGGNATENRTLLKLFPRFFSCKIPIDEPAWELIIQLKQIVELCFAPKISDSEIAYLDTLISSHLLEMKQVFPYVRFKPKHHFVQHYPELIRQYGPLVHCSTIRFEGKHKYFKSVTKRVQCFKNLSKTLAEQHMLGQSFFLAAPKLCNEEVFFL